jgi:uracil-DNA glycosylase family 4
MSELDPRAELELLVGGVRALLDQLLDTGATGLPRGLETLPARPDAAPVGAAPAAAPAPVRAMPAPAAAPAPMRAVPAAAIVRAAPGAPADAPRPRFDAPEPTALTAEARTLRLAQIEQVAATCTRCALHEGRTHPVFARGSAGAELMFVGEGPGADEDAQGSPFVGVAGQLLDKMIAAMGYPRDDVYIANVVKCRPPNNRKPEPAEAAMCVGYLHEQIALVRPKAIVALGATACEGLLGIGGITRLRGTWRLYRGEIPVMPTFHPAYLLRKPEDKRLVWGDLQQVMQRLGKSAPRR